MNFDNKVKNLQIDCSKNLIKAEAILLFIWKFIAFEWRLCLMQYLELDGNMKLCNELCLCQNERTNGTKQTKTKYLWV